MSREEILRLIKDHLRRELPAEAGVELEDTTPLLTGGLLDSSGTLALAAFLEERFGCKLHAYEMAVEYLDTPAKIAALVRSKVSPR